MIVSRRFIQAAFTSEITEVNGEPALLLRMDGHPFSLVSVTIDQQRIMDIQVIANPDKLKHLGNDCAEIVVKDGVEVYN